MSLSKHFPTTVIAAALAATTLAVPSTSTAQPAAHIACSHDVSATIHGEHKCLGPGEYCSTRYEREYERYGFECSRRYDPPRLRRR
jgi:hypothetical protein